MDMKKDEKGRETYCPGSRGSAMATVFPFLVALTPEGTYNYAIIYTCWPTSGTWGNAPYPGHQAAKSQLSPWEGSEAWYKTQNL